MKAKKATIWNDEISEKIHSLTISGITKTDYVDEMKNRTDRAEINSWK